MPVAPTAKNTPSRRRKRPHQAILAATVELLETEGYKALTIEGIAQKAGVGKQTIYRWWPSKAAIVMEAYTQKASERIPLPDRGSVYLDLQELLKRLFLVLTTTSAGAVMSSLMAEAQIDSEFAQTFRDGFIATRRQVMRELLERGRDRGELRADVDLELVIDALYGSMWYRLLNKHAPLNNQFAEELVDQLRVGIGTSAA
jgi:AcrR family transcriptional regulator